MIHAIVRTIKKREEEKRKKEYIIYPSSIYNNLIEKTNALNN